MSAILAAWWMNFPPSHACRCLCCALRMSGVWHAKHSFCSVVRGPKSRGAPTIPERGPMARVRPPAARTGPDQSCCKMPRMRSQCGPRRRVAPGAIGMSGVHVIDGVVRIAVTDNGVGLPQQDRGRLTEPYVTHKPKGTGLGLAIVKKIMEDHGGSVTLDDRSSHTNPAPDLGQRQPKRARRRYRHDSHADPAADAATGFTRERCRWRMKS